MKNLQKLIFKDLSILILLTVFSGFICLAQDIKEDQNNTNAVKSIINLIVTDKNNNFINNLGKEDISVFIDGQEQTNFTLETDKLPLLYMISADNSGSMRFLWNDIRNSVKKIIGQNKPEDLTALMRFVSFDKIQITDKFSSDEKYLFSKLDLFQIEGGQTALIDAVYDSVKIVADQKGVSDNYRRTVVVISDGEDRNSKNTAKQLSKLLIESNVQVFFIGLVNELDNEGNFSRKSPRKKAIEFIERVAKESGGVAVFPEKIEDLPEIANQIVNQMRTQFLVKLPTTENLDNKKVEMKPSKTAKNRKLKFNYRAGLIK